jgi:hypothetical protein
MELLCWSYFWFGGLVVAGGEATPNGVLIWFIDVDSLHEYFLDNKKIVSTSF